MSAARFESTDADSGLGVISITDTGTSDAMVAEGFGPVLRLRFDDLDDENLAHGSVGRVFTAKAAETVVRFLDALHRAQDMRGLLVHCEMGRSRSAAVAWYALSYGGRLLKQRRIDGTNQLVLRLLENAGGHGVPRPTGMLAPAGFCFRERPT